MKRSIILVDDTCRLCNNSTSFIIRHVKQDQFRFLSLYSPEGKTVLKKYKLPVNYDESVVLVEGERLYVKTDALLKITRRLNGLLPLLYCLIVIPRSLRDKVYSILAKHRHHI